MYYVDGLNHNLLSISQICDNAHKVVFKPNFTLFIIRITSKSFYTHRKENIYTVDLMTSPNKMFSVFHQLRILVGYGIIG